MTGTEAKSSATDTGVENAMAEPTDIGITILSIRLIDRRLDGTRGLLDIVKEGREDASGNTVVQTSDRQPFSRD